MKLDTLYIAGLTAFVTIIVILTFIFPFRSLRLDALDSTMTSALSEVSRELTSYVVENNQLPDDLTKLEFNDSYSVVNNNTGILGKITYNKDDGFGSMKFNLCADFYTEKKSNLFSQTSSETSYYDSGYVDYTSHPKGYHCFENETVGSFSDNLKDYYDQYYESLQDTEAGTEESYFN
jgi:hypothetical protein